MSRHALIRLALTALSASRAPHWLPAAPDARGLVVTLHHVRPRRLSPFDPNALLAITPEFLDRFLGHFTAKGWRFVSLEEIMATDGVAPDPRRIAVTLDDGYRDNCEHAWPVFRRHAVPFTVFVCPGFCDRTAELWWAALERVIAGTEMLSLADAGPAAELSTRSTADKRRAFRLWTKWLTGIADEQRQRRAIRALAEKYGLDLAALARELVMDWDEVRTIAADPLCTIGAHTMTHPALARLPPEQALGEMRQSAERIEAEIGQRPTTIAFPYGYAAAAGAREETIAEEAGFSASFTTRPGYVPLAGKRQGVPRVSVNGLFQDTKLLEVLLTPGLWKARDRIRRRA
jgi:peptidoglycan/xylan/chitin deacetylase (PgdA/CDA1 family)